MNIAMHSPAAPPESTFQRKPEHFDQCARCDQHESAHDWRCHTCRIVLPKDDSGLPKLSCPCGAGAFLVCPSPGSDLPNGNVAPPKFVSITGGKQKDEVAEGARELLALTAPILGKVMEEVDAGTSRKVEADVWLRHSAAASADLLRRFPAANEDDLEQVAGLADDFGGRMVERFRKRFGKGAP